MEPTVILVWKLWTVYAPMFAATAILSYVIKIRGLFKSTKWRHFKMSNLKLSRPGVKWLRTTYTKTSILVQQQVTCIFTNHMPIQVLIPDDQADN